MKILYFALVLVLFVSCGETSSNASKKQSEAKKQAPKAVTASAVEKFKFNDYILSSDADKEVSKWPKYRELSTQLSFLKKADLTFFTSEKDTLKVFIDSLKNSVPSAINTYPINNRILVLETKLLKLNNDLSLDNYALEKKLKSIKELLVANSNLIYGINKKLEFDANDIGRPE